MAQRVVLVVALVAGVVALAGCATVKTGQPASSAPPSSSPAPSSSASAAASSSPAPSFSVGQPVGAIWTDGSYFLAKVNQIDGDQITVQYSDDQTTRTVSAADVKAIPSKTWAVGDKVLAVWTSGRFYSGVISKVNGTSYEVKWDDGSAPSPVSAEKIMAP